MSNYLLFDIIIKIIRKCNFILDKTDIKNIKKEYNDLLLYGKKYKKCDMFFTIELMKYSLYFFNQLYNKMEKIYIEDILQNFLVCILLASKFIEDDCLENGILCEIFYLNKRRVNKMEIKVINILEYNLFVENHNINNFIKEIQRK